MNLREARRSSSGCLPRRNDGLGSCNDGIIILRDSEGWVKEKGDGIDGFGGIGEDRKDG